MAQPVLLPGREVMIDDVLCRVVMGTDVPKRYWAWLRTQQGARTASLMILSTKTTGGIWRFHDYLPSSPFERGAFAESYLTDEFPEYEPARVAVPVPVSWLEPERNEFGEVSP